MPCGIEELLVSCYLKVDMHNVWQMATSTLCNKKVRSQIIPVGGFDSLAITRRNNRLYFRAAYRTLFST